MLLPLEAGETVTAMLHTRDMEEGFLMMVTRGGTVKRLALSAINTRPQGRDQGADAGRGRRAHRGLQDHRRGPGNFGHGAGHGPSALTRPTSGPWAGMRRASGAARLEPGDRVVGAAVAENGKDLLTVTQNGLRQADGALPAYLRDGEAQNRGRQGPEELPSDRQDRSGGRGAGGGRQRRRAGH